MPDPVCAPAPSALARCVSRALPTVAGLEIALPDQGLDIDAFLEALGRALTAQALERSGGNKSRAARLLGLERTTLVERLKRWGPLGQLTQKREQLAEERRQWTACE